MDDTFQGLECLGAVGGSVSITSTNAHEVSLPRLATIGGDFSVRWSPTSSFVLPKLESIGGMVLVTDVLMSDLEGLSSVRHVGSLVSVAGTNLSSLDGIQDALRDSTGLILSQALNLADTDALTGLPESVEVLSIGYCGVISFSQDLPTRHADNLTVSNTLIRDLAFLVNLEDVQALTLSSNPELVDLSGLGGVVSSDLDQMYIAENTVLRDLRGLEGIGSVAGDTTV